MRTQETSLAEGERSLLRSPNVRIEQIACSDGICALFKGIGNHVAEMLGGAVDGILIVFCYVEPHWQRNIPR